MSNQFPIQIKQVASRIISDPTNLNDKSRLFYQGLKKNLPNLYNYIKNKRGWKQTN